MRSVSHIVTMFDGSVGLMAIASSASLPGMTLASKFAGSCGTAAAALSMVRRLSIAPTLGAVAWPRTYAEISS